MTEGHKNIIGSYYTPPRIVRNMTEGLDFSQGQTFLDPCCGSGAYLMSLNCSNPQQLFGMDRDRIAVMICRINLLIKYRDKAFVPQIYCEDFLQTDRFSEMQFDYIMTNPPWGAVSDTSHGRTSKSGETFSHFFVRSYELLRCGGRMRFLFPYSVLNVKTHKELRRFMLEHGNLRMITVYDRVFSGVTTDCVDIELHNCETEETMTVCSGGRKYETNKQWIDKTHNCAFHLMSEESHSVVEQVYSQPYQTLDGSEWALGIVTAEEIDKMNILRASITAMHRAIDGLKVKPEHLIIDGNKFMPYKREGTLIPHTTIVKGDGKYLSIAAASILAKTYRDDYMKKLHQEFPFYGWDHNAGYPTKEHRQGIEIHGTTPYHRMTFNLLGAVQLELPFA
jgi:ribonuclease HII/predicted RNA methylase